MTKPIEITPHTFHGWKLDAIIDELLASDQASHDGKSARTLVKSSALTVVLTVLRRGDELREHHAPGPVFVVPLRGEVTFRHGNEDTAVGVEGQQVLAMGPGQPHAVVARTDAAFLLVLGSS